MKKYKYLSVLLIALLLSTTLIGCGRNEQSDEPIVTTPPMVEQETEPEPEEPEREIEEAPGTIVYEPEEIENINSIIINNVELTDKTDIFVLNIANPYNNLLLPETSAYIHGRGAVIVFEDTTTTPGLAKHTRITGGLYPERVETEITYMRFYEPHTLETTWNNLTINHDDNNVIEIVSLGNHYGFPSDMEFNALGNRISMYHAGFYVMIPHLNIVIIIYAYNSALKPGADRAETDSERVRINEGNGAGYFTTRIAHQLVPAIIRYHYAQE